MLDVLVHNATVMTVDPQNRVLTNGAVAVNQGRIDRVWSLEKDSASPPAREVIDAGGGLVMPGLVNVHTHLPMSMFRGMADDMALDQWLNQHIFPAEAKFISPQSVAVGTRLSVAEMLLGGTTTCCDGYFLTDHIAGAVEASGIRAILGQGVIDFPAPGVPDPADNVAVGRRFAQQWMHRSPRIRPSIFCHSPYACSSETLQSAKAAAADAGVLFQIHVAETRSEVRQCRSEHGCSPVALLQRLGVLDENTLLVHMVWVDDADVQCLADSGARVAHCPESNMKLASGVAPVPDFLAAGLTVGLGTDGCASNNDLSLWHEMDAAAKLHKVHRLDPTVMSAETVLRMATIDGARAIGMDRRIGSLEPGKQADLVIVDTRRPHLTPLYNPVSHAVYAASAADVRHVMIDGRWVVRDRQLLTMDLAAVLDAAQDLGRRIAGRET